MNFKHWIAIAGCAAIAASCGDSSTKDKDETKDTTTVTTTAPVNPSPSAPMVEVPEPTRTAFTTKYPKASNATWGRYEPVEYIDWGWAGWPSMDTSDYYVRYNMDGNDYWTWYDDAGAWVGTVSTVTNYSGLPTPVNNAVNSNFAGYTITSVQMENDKNRTAYEIKLEKGADKAKLLVAEDGKVIKKVNNPANGEKTKEKMQ
ncbi:MAG TPA: PepSY-like domain-containing protein [Chitinophagaceae bacterium]|nr:PepSY-like domain-containing protein [Chitinophagaceae bacterium]